MRGLGWLAAAGFAALSASAMSASAAPVDNNQLIACEPSRADVASVDVEDLRFGLKATYVWASATIHVTLRDGRTREYALSGRADPIEKTPRPNRARAGFAYSDFTCIVQYRAIMSVRNCAAARKQRSCEVGVTVFGVPVVYSVSMTAERNKIVEASTVP
ncbi:MAG: hypothetical protein WDM94_04640 [Bauldia sp.]